MKTKKAEAIAAASATNTGTLRVAYHDGPPEIGYFGSQWQRGVAQEVTTEAWAAMQKRADFGPFDFRIQPETPAADKE